MRLLLGFGIVLRSGMEELCTVVPYLSKFLQSMSVGINKDHQSLQFAVRVVFEQDVNV